MPDNKNTEKILDAAFKLFLERGYEATGIREICREANIAAPTVYYYYESKKGLFFAAARRMWECYNALTADLEKSFEFMSPDLKLYNIFLISIKFALNHPREFRFYLRYTLFPPEELKDEINAFLDDTRHKIELLSLSCLHECVDTGLIRTEFPKAMRTYWKFVNNNTIDIVLSHWSPTDTELKSLWDLFFIFRLNGHQQPPHRN